MREVIVVLGAVAALVLGTATATAVTPPQGPTAGGTSVLIESEGLHFVQVSAGEGHTAALTADGALYAWGENSSGQLGDGTTADSAVPAPVDTSGVLDGVKLAQVSAGYSHTVALADDGAVYAWGYGFYGQLGNGATGGSASSAVPVAVDLSAVPAGRTITTIAAGFYSTTAIDSEGAVYTWGNGAYGQLGNGTTTSTSVPTAVDTAGALSGTRITQVAAGWDHMVAVADTGAVYAWGANASGQLGNSSMTPSAVPVPVDTADALSGVAVTQVAVGATHSLALGTDGRVFAWGGNDRGQLGTGDITAVPVPVDISGSGALAGRAITQIGGGWEHSVALGADGAVLTWGGNGFGQLGNGSEVDSPLPLVADGTGAIVTGIDAGWEHTIATTSGGIPYAWGYNFFGQAGDGTTDNASSPIATVMPELQVLFGDIPAVSAARDDPATVEAVTPPHASGIVDIEIRQGGNARYAQTTELLASAYTFGSAPLIVDDPDSSTVAARAEIELTAVAEGDEAPAAQWQFRAADTDTWEDIAGGADVVTGTQTVSKITVSAPAAGSTEYQVVFTNALGTATSTNAVLTVLTPGWPGTETAVGLVPGAAPDPTDVPIRTVSPTAEGADADSADAVGANPPDGPLAFTGLGAAGISGVAALAMAAGLLLQRTRARRAS